MAEVNKLNMARMQYTHACRLEGQEMMHVGIALVNLFITKIYGPVIRRVLPKAMNERFKLAPDKRYSDTCHIVTV